MTANLSESSYPSNTHNRVSYEIFMPPTLKLTLSGCRVMARRKIRDTGIRIAIGITAALCITWIAFRFHFNLSSATSIHLLLVTAIALRWSFFEASVVSLLSVACLDYFFTEPVFKFYMTDSHDWIALITFESVALLVSRLSNKVSRHARDSEIHRCEVHRPLQH